MQKKGMKFMIKYTEKDNLKTLISKEKEQVKLFDSFQTNMKQALEGYINEFKDIEFENDVLKTMFLNNFSNSIVQIDNNLSNINSLSNVLEIIEKQDTISKEDIETYNKLFSNVEQDIGILQKFLSQTISNSENVPTKIKKKSTNSLNKFKETILKDISDTNLATAKNSEENKVTTKSIKKKFDTSSSDLLCFFPKKPSESLVISTSQENYKISFNGETAKISIEDENFNLSLKTSGIQVSNSVTGNILFVTNSGGKYIIITNSQIEIPPFIQVSKISKNEDFLEVEIINTSLNLIIENNITNFESEDNFSKNISEKPIETPIVKPSSNKEPNVEDSHFEEKEQLEEPVQDKLTDNDTLIISDSNKTVILPYNIADLEEKLKNNKKYRTLEEVIQKEYTLPIETFKNPTKSRFREAFQLIKKKEHGSLKEAIELGFELMFESDLNPAIIAACRDLDELDIYLDCLDDNELDKFSCFKIKYDVPPTKKSKKR